MWALQRCGYATPGGIYSNHYILQAQENTRRVSVKYVFFRIFLNKPFHLHLLKFHAIQPTQLKRRR